MSKTELHIGTLKEVDLNGLTAEDWCQNFLFEKFKSKKPSEILDGMRTYIEAFNEYSYNISEFQKYIILKNRVFEISDKECDPCGHSSATKNPDGTISYFALWYNGGAGFEEVLEDCLDEIEGD